MKKKFISVAMFLALAVSSPVWVGCADYDDDIANLQSQVDGLKQSVEVSTAEAISALQSAQGDLQKELDDLKALNTDGEANELVTAVKDLQAALANNNITDAGELAALSGKVQDLVNLLNENVPQGLSDLEKKVDEQKAALEKQIEDETAALEAKDAELQKLIDEKATSEDINGLQEEIDSLKQELLEHNEAYTEFMNGEFATVKNWVDNNGTELAKLTSKVAEIESLLTYLDEAKQNDINSITEPDVLAHILALDDLNTEVDQLQQQIGNAETANTILYRLKELETWKSTLLTNLFNGSGYENLVDMATDIKELQKALLGSAEGEEPTAGLEAQFNALKLEMAKLDMIQSVVYIPNWDETTSEVSQYLLETAELKVWNGTAYSVIKQSVVNNTISFRVSPASKAADFEGEHPKYVLSLDGTKIGTKAEVGTVKLTKADATTGIITYEVNTNIGDNEVYGVCAVIKSVDSQDSEGNAVSADKTELTTTYFTVTKTTDNVKTVKVSSTSEKAQVPYDKATINYAEGIKIVGIGEDGITVKVADMVEKYGAFDVAYAFVDNAAYNKDNFNLSGGTLTLKNPTNAMIDEKIQVVASVKFAENLVLESTEAFDEVRITRRTVEYTVPTPRDLTWKKDAQYIPLTQAEMQAIVGETELQNATFDDLVTDNNITTSAPTTITLITANEAKTINGGTYPAAVQEVLDDLTGDSPVKANHLFLYVPAYAFADASGEETITLKESGSTSTTQTDSYVFTVKYNASEYPETNIEKNRVRWSADNTSDFVPQINDTNNDGKIDEVGYIYDASDLIANYATLKAGEHTYGYELVIEPAEAVTGVQRVTGTDKFEFTSAYVGDKLTLNVYLKYHTNGTDKKVSEASCAIDVTAMSGKFYSRENYKIEIEKLSQTYNVAEGTAWKDVQDRTIWEAGKVVPTGAAEGAQFASNPFGLYRLEAPTYSIEKATTASGTDVLASVKQWITISSEGILSFTQQGLQSSYAEEVTITVRISAGSKWGHISGLTPGDSKDYTDVTVVIPKDTTAY